MADEKDAEENWSGKLGKPALEKLKDDYSVTDGRPDKKGCLAPTMWTSSLTNARTTMVGSMAACTRAPKSLS